jgi:hypothetical protein
MYENGVYFDLPAENYHADPALGATSLKALTYDPALYWFESGFNPLRQEEQPTKAQTIGTAVHTMVLDGPEAFKARYRPMPGNEAMRNADEIEAWLKARGIKPARTKKAMIAQAVEADPDILIHDHQIAKAEAQGIILLRPEDYTRIVQAAQTIAANPHLRNAVRAGYREVSVFWSQEVDGFPIRRKARFDYLRPRAVVDLKSITPAFGKGFDAECRRAIVNWRYDIQAAAYLQARAQLAQHVAAGRVFGDVDREWLNRVAAQTEYAFVFVFWASDGAPLTWGGVLSPGNPILEVAEASIETALRTYLRCVQGFAEGAPWIEPQPLQEIFWEDMPAYFGR